MGQDRVSHHQLLLLRFGQAILDYRQRRRRVGVELPLAGAHGDCESEVGLKSGHNP